MHSRSMRPLCTAFSMGEYLTVTDKANADVFKGRFVAVMQTYPEARGEGEVAIWVGGVAFRR